MPVEQRFPEGVPSGVEGMPPVVIATGQQTLYFTGQIAPDNNGRLVGDTLEEQTVQVFRNLEAAAVDVGVTASDIAYLRFHIVTDDFQAGLDQVLAAAVPTPRAAVCWRARCLRRPWSGSARSNTAHSSKSTWLPSLLTEPPSYGESTLSTHRGNNALAECRERRSMAPKRAPRPMMVLARQRGRLTYSAFGTGDRSARRAPCRYISRRHNHALDSDRPER